VYGRRYGDGRIHLTITGHRSFCRNGVFAAEPVSVDQPDFTDAMAVHTINSYGGDTGPVAEVLHHLKG
jgi:hypothetical protein